MTEPVSLTPTRGGIVTSPSANRPSQYLPVSDAGSPDAQTPTSRTFTMPESRSEVEVVPPFEIGGRPQQTFKVNGDLVIGLPELKSKYPMVYDEAVKRFPDLLKKTPGPAAQPPAAKPTNLAQPTIAPAQHFLFHTQAGDIAPMKDGNALIIGHYDRMKDAKAMQEKLEVTAGDEGNIHPWLKGEKSKSMWAVLVRNVPMPT